jgi:hypothetical protein
MLWAFGRFGELEEGGSRLVLDSETYLAQKIQSSYPAVMEYTEALRKQGVHCELVPLVEEGWRTPKGTLRKAGWLMRVSFDDDAGGAAALEALQSYVAMLDGEYGTRAFRYYSKANMRVLGEGA